MGPHFRPFWLQVSVDGGPELVRGGLVVVLTEKQLANSIMREGVAFVYLERLLIFPQRCRKIVDLDKLFAPPDERCKFCTPVVAQQDVIRIECKSARFSECVHTEF